MSDNEVGPRGAEARSPGEERARGSRDLKRGSDQGGSGRTHGGRGTTCGPEEARETQEGLGRDHGLPSEPQAELQNGPNMVADAVATPEAEEQPPALRRGRSRDLGPRGQRNGERMIRPPPTGGVCGFMQAFLY